MKGLEPLAMELAAEAYEALESSRENAESRASLYVDLARAVFAVTPDEASAYLERAIEISSRIGDENLGRWSALLSLAESAGKVPFPRPKTVYRLSRVAELTYQYVARDKHFDWERTIEALADLGGESALAIISRWRDRRFGSRRRQLPILVYRLLEKGTLPPSAPIALAGTTAWWKRQKDLQRALSAESNPSRRQALAQVAYRYMRVQQESREFWSMLKEVSEGHGLELPDLERLISVSPAGDEKGNPFPASGDAPPAPKRRLPDWDLVFRGVDLADPGSTLTAYASIRNYDPPYEFSSFFREAVARASVGQRAGFVRAVAAWPDFGMFELRDLLDALPSPIPNQVALRRAIKSAVILACDREPERVFRRRWASVVPFDRLDTEGVVPDIDVVRATLSGFSTRVDRLTAGEFFQLLDSLAAFLQPDAADEALNFGLDLLEDGLEPSDGDGPWRSELQPPSSVPAALAGYIWAGLGSPVVAERWECAHVVRAIIELELHDVLDALVNFETISDGGTFADKGLEFYIWHARQWLLVGIARGALENPAALRSAVPLLKRCLREDHVLIRELAAHTLRSLVGAGVVADMDAAGSENINQTGLPEEKYSGLEELEDEAEASPEGPPEDAKVYSFDYDISRYWFEPLGRAFGLTGNAIERRAGTIVRARMAWQGGSSWRDDARRTRKIFDDGEAQHSHGSLPATDDLHSYHGYHSMMMVAAELLRGRSVRRHTESATDEFREWLVPHQLTRTDGRWLSDRRDPQFTQVHLPPDWARRDLWCWGVTAEHLAQQLVTDDGLKVLWGRWTSGDADFSETVSVRSALVSRVGAEALAVALQMAPRFGHFTLPSAGSSEDLEAGPLKLKGWVVDERISAGLDDGDPWGRRLFYPGPAPCNSVIRALDLKQQTDLRTWTSGSGAQLRAELWTHVQSNEREEDVVPGERLSGNVVFLKHMLDANPGFCLVFSVEVRRRPPRERERDHTRTTQPYTRYYITGADGVLHTL